MGENARLVLRVSDCLGLGDHYVGGGMEITLKFQDFRSAVHSLQLVFVRRGRSVFDYVFSGLVGQRLKLRKVCFSRRKQTR